MSNYLTPDDVASQLQVSRQVVYNWINDGRLRAVKAGRTLRIPHAALETFLQPVQAGDIATGTIEPNHGYHLSRFTAAAQAALTTATNQARIYRHPQLEVEHLLWALLQQGDSSVVQALLNLSVDLQQVTQQVEHILKNLPSDHTIPYSPHVVAVSPRIPKLLRQAEALASVFPDLQIDTSHLLQAISQEPDGVSAQILHSSGVTPEQLRVVLLNLRAIPERTNCEQRIEQQLTRIEMELAAIRSLLIQHTNSGTE